MSRWWKWWTVFLSGAAAVAAMRVAWPIGSRPEDERYSPEWGFGLVRWAWNGSEQLYIRSDRLCAAVAVSLALWLGVSAFASATAGYRVYRVFWIVYVGLLAVRYALLETSYFPIQTGCMILTALFSLAVAVYLIAMLVGRAIPAIRRYLDLSGLAIDPRALIALPLLLAIDQLVIHWNWIGHRIAVK